MAVLDQAQLGGVTYDLQDTKAQAMIAPAFSAAQAYSAGDSVTYNGTLYTFTADHAAGAWIGTDAATVPDGVTGEVADLKSAIAAIQDDLYSETVSPASWTIGNWNTSTGTAGTNNKRIRTALPTINGLDYFVKADPGVLFYPVFWDANGSFLALESTLFFNECDIKSYAPTGAAGFRLVARTDPETTLTDVVDATAAKIHWYTQRFDEKIDKDQGVANAGLALVVGSDGIVSPGVSDTEKQIKSVKTITDMIELHKSINLCNPADIAIGRLNQDGSFDDEITSVATTDYIPVEAGQSVQIFRNNSGAAARIYHTRLARYDASKSLIGDVSTATSNNAYTVATGVSFIRFSFDATYKEPMVAVNYTNGDPYIPYTAPYVTTDYDMLTPVSSQMLANAPMRGKKIVNFGDSIFGNFRAVSGSSESISSMVSKMTGAACHNVAFGGTHAKTMSGTARAPMDFQSLVTAIIANDWSAQESYATQQGDDYLARVQALEAIDFSEIDVVTISYGTNDWSSQVTPDQYEAALTDGITRLGTAYPNLLFVICTPIIRFKHSDDSGSDDAEDSGGESEGTGEIISSDTIESSSGYKLPQYAEKVESVGHAMHCPVCENYWTLGINLQNYSTFMGGMAAADLVHPNAKGRRLIANHLADALIRL